jgi:hypothetical protein
MLKRSKKATFDVEAFIAGSVEGLKLMTETHRNAWRLGQEQSWRVDEVSGRIMFSFAGGADVSAPVQVIGTHHTAQQTFTWGWEHPAVPRKLQAHAARVRSFAKEYRVQELLTQQVFCIEQRAWEYTALAMLLAEAAGAYRVRIAPDNFAYLTFGEVTLHTSA